MKKSIIHVGAMMAAVLPVMASESQSETEFTDSTHYDLNPVVVTGTGVHQRLKATPVPVEVISGREIRSAGINGLQDALTMMVPSLSFSPSAMGSYLRMNGLTNSHVAVLLNGRKMTGDISGNIDLGQIDINLIKRIEVLNGAASTLYGSDAVGGVINIITAGPDEESEFTTNSRYTRDGQFNQGLDLSLRAGRVGSLTAYNYSHSDGWQNSRYTEDDGELMTRASVWLFMPRAAIIAVCSTGQSSVRICPAVRSTTHSLKVFHGEREAPTASERSAAPNLTIRDARTGNGINI